MNDARHYALGVDLGTTYTCAAVADATGPARVAQLSGTSHTIPSVVSISDGKVLTGEAAERRLVSHPADTAREFKRRFGDPAPIVLAGTPQGAEVLTGHLLSEVIARVGQNEGVGPATVALSHPASWGPFRLDLLRAAAGQAGVDDVVLVPEPVAAAIANRDRVEAGSLAAVYDLGGGTFDAAVVRADGDWSVVGTPEGVERLGGIDFDQAILAHVDAALDGQVFALDTSDPDARSALMQLRAECQSAKEHLSEDTDVDIPVSLPNLRTSVRLTRGEFEAMVRPRLADSLAVFDRVVASAGAGWVDISAVLLVGGSANIPIVGQLVSEHTGRPVISATNPHLAIAIGTATIAAERLAAATVPPAAATAPIAAAADAPTSPDGGAAATATTGGSRRPWGYVFGGFAIVALLIVGFLMLSGGDSDSPSDATTDNSLSAGDPDPTAPPSTEPVDTAPPATEPPSVPDVTIGVQACGAGDPAIVAVLEQAGSLLAVGDDAVSRLEGATLEPCSIDVATRTPEPGISLPAAPIAAASWGDGLVVATPSGGVLSNATTGNIFECDLVTGPPAINSAGVVFPIVDGTALRVRTRQDGCSEQDNSALTGIETTAVAAIDEMLAIGGSVDGVVELWVFTTPDDRTVLGGSGAEVPGGFGSIDAVVGCDGSWCVIDLAGQAVHLVTSTGEYVGFSPLADTSLGGAARIVSSGPTAGGAALVTAEFGDGTRTIASLVVS